MPDTPTLPMSADLRLPCPLSDATDRRRCGQKAVSLAQLIKAGHRVPDGFVVPPDGVVDHGNLGAALAGLGPGPYAVRSSGVAEDLEDASFAGQFETVLGPSSLDEVIDAIAAVRASATSGRARDYRAARGHDDAAMAVIVQRLVPARTSGVAFSANPVTGDDEVVIEAVAGLGDRLVGGQADGDRWVDAGDGPKAQVDTGVLDRKLATEVAALVRRVAAERGQPQDIEWVAADGELFLVQARPITALPRPPHIEIPEGRWMKDVGHFSGPMTPMGASILLPAYEEAVGLAICEDFAAPLETIRHRSFGGELYTQEVDFDGKHRPEAPPPWWLMAIVIRLVPSMRRRMKAAAAALPKLDEYPRLWETTWRSECIARIEAAQAFDLDAATDAELLRELDRVIDEVLRVHVQIHFRLTVPNVVGVHDLVQCCRELLGWDVPKTMNLLGGLSTASTAPVREIETIAARVSPELLARGLAAVLDGDAGPDLRAWLDRWGLRTINADPGEPSFAERDDLILGLLRGVSSSPAAQLAELRKSTRAEALAALAGEDKARFEAALAYAERVYPQREDNVPYTEGLSCGVVRRVLLAIARRLVATGALAAVEDVAYLERGELRPALEGSDDAVTVRERVRRRQAERAWVRAHPGPLVHGPAPVPLPDIRGIPRYARRTISAMLWAIEHELTPPTPSASDGETLAGVGGAPGRYRGPVRVIRSHAQLHQLQPGEVLVCPTTDTNWGPFFSTAGALVLDGGGILSHPAIIAREHGIPAVVATGRATAMLRDGQIVTVDGTTGRVQLG